MEKEIFNITVVMPALNEEKNIQGAINAVLKAFNDSGLNGEIIVVNDGSRDGTEQLVNDILKTEKNGRVKMIKHETPMGIGASFWDGVDAARGEIVTWVPGDNENEPLEIFRYFELLKHVDIVVPFVINKEVRAPLRNIVSSVYRFIINVTFRVNFNYTNGTVLIRKSVLKNICFRNNGFFFQADILIRAAKSGYLFAEVPYRLGVRGGGASKALSIKSFLRIAKSYFKLVKDIYFNKTKQSGCPADSMTYQRLKPSLPDYKVSLIIPYDENKKLLLQHRTNDARLLPGYWAFFGGGLKPGETPLSAVLRETREELNYTLKAPELVLEREFTEGATTGYLYIYVEKINGGMSNLRLLEGQGWGWYTESDIKTLKMTDRDREIFKYITEYLEKRG